MTATCCARAHRCGARGPGRGALDAGDVPARVHVRACPPARPAARRGAARAWAAGAGPGDGRLVVDVDSFIGEVHGYRKQGAGFGYTRRRGYHPMLATRADTGEVLHIRLRKGSAASPRGVLRFADELIARVARAGASGPKLLRADSAFWNKKLIARLQQAGWQYSISVRLQAWVKDAISAIPETRLAAARGLPRGGEAQIAETIARRAAAGRAPHPTGRRAGRAVARLAALRVHHQPHRAARARRGRAPPARRRRARDPRPQRPGARALPLRPLHRQRRLDRDRLPRAQPAALDHPDRPARHTVRAARTLRRRLLALPGRLTRTARRWTLHLPARWPWQHDFVRALARIRACPPPPDRRARRRPTPTLPPTPARRPLHTNTPKRPRANARTASPHNQPQRSHRHSTSTTVIRPTTRSRPTHGGSRLSSDQRFSWSSRPGAANGRHLGAHTRAETGHVASCRPRLASLVCAGYRCVLGDERGSWPKPRPASRWGP